MSIARNISASLLLHGSILAAALMIGGSSASLREHLIQVTLFQEQSGDAVTSVQPVSPSTPAKKRGATVQTTDSMSSPEKLADSNTLSFQKQYESVHPETEKQPSSITIPSAGSGPGTASQGQANEKTGRVGSISGPGNDGLGSQRGHDYTKAVGLIRTRIEQHLVYPYLAIRKRIEGTVTAEFSVGPKGQPTSVIIAKSSGHQILDTAAQETIEKAAPFPAVEGTVEIPITFRLKE